MPRVLATLTLALLATHAAADDPPAVPANVKYSIGRSYQQEWLSVLDISADGKTVATTHPYRQAKDYSTPVLLWDVATGKHRATLEGVPHHSRIAAFSPDGSLIATGGGDKILRFWDAATGEDITPADGIRLDWSAYSLAFTADGKRLLVGTGGLVLIEVNRGRRVKVAFEGVDKKQWYGPVAISADGRYAAAGAYHKPVKVWDTTTGKLTPALEDDVYGGLGSCGTLAFSADGKYLSGRMAGATFGTWEVATGKRVRLIRWAKGEPPEHLAFSADTARVAWSEPAGEPTAVVTADGTGKALARVAVPVGVYSIHLSRDGSRLAVGGRDGSVRVNETDTGKEVRTLIDGWPGVDRAFYADGGKTLRVVFLDGLVRDYDSATGKDLRSVRLARGKELIAAVSPDGSLLATVTEEGQATVWNLATGKALCRPEGKLRWYAGPWPGSPPGPAFLLAFADDNRFLVGRREKDIAVWDTRTGAVRHTLGGIDDPHGTFAIPAGTDTLFAGRAWYRGRDDEVVLRQFDLKTGRELKGWKAPPAPARDDERYMGTTVWGVTALSDERLAITERDEYVYAPNPPPPPRPGPPMPPIVRHAYRLRVIDRTGDKPDRVVVGDLFEPPVVSAGGKYAVAISQIPHEPLARVNLIDLETGKTLSQTDGIPLADLRYRRSLAVHPERKELLLTTAEGPILVLDTAKE